MKIQVTVKPNSKRERVEQINEGEYLVAVNAPAQEGKANKAVIAILSKHFKTRKSAIQISRGLKGRKKIIVIDDK